MNYSNMNNSNNDGRLFLIDILQIQTANRSDGGC